MGCIMTDPHTIATITFTYVVHIHTFSNIRFVTEIDLNKQFFSTLTNCESVENVLYPSAAFRKRVSVRKHADETFPSCY